MENHSRIRDILRKMTLEEKSELCMGKDDWSTHEFPQHGIPSVMMTDGTNGVRFNKTDDEIRAEMGDDAEYTFFDVTTLSQDSVKLNYIHPSTCFPSGSAIASSWDREMVKEIATAVAQECKKQKLSLLLGPGMNTRCNPLGGRSFEYFSEDPVVSGEIAAAYVSGLQENGVGGTLKHYTCNNSETLRTKTDCVVDERALREIYLAGFERALKAQPWSVMSSYNILNGVQMAENKRLLTDILRDEWGFQGFVVSDWWGIKDRIAAAKAGNDMEMPFNAFNPRILSDAVKSGELEEATLDTICENILDFVFKAYPFVEDGYQVDYEQQHLSARKALEEACVLLKNEDRLLPLSAGGQRILVAGSIAKSMRYQGGGCALVNPTRLDQPYDEIVLRAGAENVAYAQGYRNDDTTDEALLADAATQAKACDVVVVFGGLAISTDVEGSDRQSLDIEQGHVRLIEAVAAVNPNVVVVLNNGECVVMPWLSKAKAVLETFMCGQAGGSAIARILFGEVNPSGKLTVTFPQRIEDLAGFLEFPGENARNLYGEGIYVGYRYFEKKKIPPLFPFGHGLSYTTFAYSNLTLSKQHMTDKETLSVSLSVKNTGERAGKEVVQLYVSPPVCRLRRPIKELKGFEKIALAPGESNTVTFDLGFRDFAYYDTEFSDWIVDSGSYTLCAGPSSAELPLQAAVDMTATVKRHPKLHLDTVHVELFQDEEATKLYFDWLIEKGVFKPKDIDEKLHIALLQSFVGLYNTLPTFSKRVIPKAEFQAFLDEANAKLGR